ncbi:MAG: TatD family hydrolase [Clostridia bacterium]|nr:TatD family hydrolase [Clostridia bacterium]
MKIIDVHAHYEDERYNEDREETLKRQYENGVEHIINAGAGIESSKGALDIANSHENVYCTIGIHPEYVEEGENIEDLKKLYVENSKDKIVAIGEIGLDYHYTKEFKEEQKKLFKEQLEFAYEVGLPVQIHSRDASIDTVEVLESADKKPDKIMFHCFDLNEQTAKYIIEKGYKISVGGNITYKRTDTAIRVIKEMPIESIMTETDSPYLTPVPHRGERNESLNIAYVIEKIAEIKEMDKEQVAKILYNNAVEFYGLG